MRQYGDRLTVTENLKGVLDVDAVKGCAPGMAAYPNGGCYGECYANKTAARRGIDFRTSVLRRPHDGGRSALRAVQRHGASWYRVGVAGDPSHDWAHTISVCELLAPAGKTPVIVTKHWRTLSDADLHRLLMLGAVVNTSTSGLDSDAETAHRTRQITRLGDAGVKSVTRVVTCEFGRSEWARRAKERQDHLLSLRPVIDNPLRVTKSNPRVVSGEIIACRVSSAIGGGKMVSLHDRGIYLGTCGQCPDQCGVTL